MLHSRKNLSLLVVCGVSGFCQLYVLAACIECTNWSVCFKCYKRGNHAQNRIKIGLQDVVKRLATSFESISYPQRSVTEQLQNNYTLKRLTSGPRVGTIAPNIARQLRFTTEPAYGCPRVNTHIR